MEPKLLSDYPVGEPFEAADGCQYCPAIYQVTITSVEGGLGNVEYSLIHEEGCAGRWDEDGENLEEEPDTVGWTLYPHVATFGNWIGQPLTYRANIGPCLKCWKLIVGVPLILYDPDGLFQIDFCFKCVKNLELIKLLNIRAVRDSE